MPVRYRRQGGRVIWKNSARKLLTSPRQQKPLIGFCPIQCGKPGEEVSGFVKVIHGKKGVFPEINDENGADGRKSRGQIIPCHDKVKRTVFFRDQPYPTGAGNAFSSL